MAVHVTSIDALGAFRARLIVFISAATQALDEAASEVRRTRQWIRNEQKFHWDGEVRKRQKKLDQALQELMGARLSSLREASAAQETAVTRARRALHEAQEKLRLVKKWDRNFDLVVDPLAKQMDGLRTVLDHDMPRALAFLGGAQRALEQYAGVRTPTEEVPEPPVEPENPSS